MASDYIKIALDQSAGTQAAPLVGWLEQLRLVYEQGVRLRAKMQHNYTSNANPALIDWGQLQTLFGIPVVGGNSLGVTANGAIVFTFLDGAVGSMEGTLQSSAVKDATERVGR